MASDEGMMEANEFDEDIRCKRCGESGLCWVEDIDRRWRLMDPLTRIIHQCRKRKGGET